MSKLLGAAIAVFVFAILSSGSESKIALAQQPPPAPTNLIIEGPNLIWTDNSDVEEGFRIRRSIDGGPPAVLATVPANTTSASIPQGSPPEDPCATQGYSVVAFNDAGESAPSNTVGVVVTDCNGLPAPTAVSPAGLPSTGQSVAQHEDNDTLIAVSLFSLGLAAVGIGVALRFLAGRHA